MSKIAPKVAKGKDNQNNNYNKTNHTNVITDIANKYNINQIQLNDRKLTSNKNIIFNKLRGKESKYITANDIIGEKVKLDIDILRMFFSKYEKAKSSKRSAGIIKSYAVNTYQGIIRNYNEDRVIIIINLNKPPNYHRSNWPKISFFGIYDGHGGDGCSEYLKDNLHKLIFENNKYFPDNIPEAIKLGFSKAENEFFNNHALNKDKEIIDRAGSCAIIIIMVDNKIYVANVGDSRCVLSMNNGKKFVEVTKDHKPNSPTELQRIKNNGGNIYHIETLITNLANPKLNGKILVGPCRVLPGRLSVSRTIGDAEAKMEKFGGNPKVLIAEPEIFSYNLDKDDIDFLILGCDGIFDQNSSDDVLNCAWMILKEEQNVLVKNTKNLHEKSELIVDLIMKSSLARKSFDNVSCVFIALKDFGKPESGVQETSFINTNNKRIITPNPRIIIIPKKYKDNEKSDSIKYATSYKNIKLGTNKEKDINLNGRLSRHTEYNSDKLNNSNNFYEYKRLNNTFLDLKLSNKNSHSINNSYTGRHSDSFELKERTSTSFNSYSIKEDKIPIKNKITHYIINNTKPSSNISISQRKHNIHCIFGPTRNNKKNYSSTEEESNRVGLTRPISTIHKRENHRMIISKDFRKTLNDSPYDRNKRRVTISTCHNKRPNHMEKVINNSSEAYYIKGRMNQ